MATYIIASNLWKFQTIRHFLIKCKSPLKYQFAFAYGIMAIAVVSNFSMRRARTKLIKNRNLLDRDCDKIYDYVTLRYKTYQQNIQSNVWLVDCPNKCRIPSERYETNAAWEVLDPQVENVYARFIKKQYPRHCLAPSKICFVNRLVTFIYC